MSVQSIIANMHDSKAAKPAGKKSKYPPGAPRTKYDKNRTAATPAAFAFNKRQSVHLSPDIWITGNTKPVNTSVIVPRTESVAELNDVIGMVCSVINGERPVYIGTVSRSCAFGLTCTRDASANHGHTHAEYLFLCIMRMLYNRPHQPERARDEYSVYDCEEDVDAVTAYYYKLPQHQPDQLSVAVPRKNLQGDLVLALLEGKWKQFVEGRASMPRIGASGSDLDDNTRWCNGPICFAYLEKGCDNRHNNDVVALSQILRCLISIKTQPVRSVSPARSVSRSVSPARSVSPVSPARSPVSSASSASSTSTTYV